MKIYLPPINKRIEMPIWLCVCVLSLALLNSHSAFAAKLYKWVDKNGNVSYQDSPPPEGSKVVREEEIDTPSDEAQSNTQPTETVTVYTVENCEACDILKLRLQNWNVPFNEQSLQDREVQARILQLSDSLQAPTLFIGDKLVSDLTGPNLISELQQTGFQIETASNQDSSNTDTSNSQ